jgi:hypothetical protein
MGGVRFKKSVTPFVESHPCIMVATTPCMRHPKAIMLMLYFFIISIPTLE